MDSSEPTVEELRVQLDEAHAHIRNLEQALIHARQIGTAIGILMCVHRIDSDAAFQMLVHGSQRTHRKLRDLADEVILTGQVPGNSTRPDAP